MVDDSTLGYIPLTSGYSYGSAVVIALAKIKINIVWQLHLWFQHRVIAILECTSCHCGTLCRNCYFIPLSNDYGLDAA